MVQQARFPSHLDPVLEYARMHVEVMSWVKDAQDDDERERLTELAEYYLSGGIESGNRARVSIRTGLSSDILEALDSGKDLRAGRALHPTEAKLVQMCFAI